MREDYIKFILDNQLMFTGNVSMSQEQREKLYEIYNYITGQNARPTSCGRCVANVKRLVYAEFIKLTNND
jgi:hypothetical protein